MMIVVVDTVIDPCPPASDVSIARACAAIWANSASVQRGHRVDCSTEIDTETLGHPPDLGSCQDSMNDGTQSLFVVCAGVQQLLEVGRVDDMLLRSEVRTGQRRAQEQGYDGT